MSDQVAGFSVADATEIKRRTLVEGASATQPLQFEQFDGWFLAFTTAGATARSGSTLGSGTADLKAVDNTNAIVDLSREVTFYNWSATAIGANKYIWLMRYGPRFVVISEECTE